MKYHNTLIFKSLLFILSCLFMNVLLAREQQETKVKADTIVESDCDQFDTIKCEIGTLVAYCDSICYDVSVLRNDVNNITKDFKVNEKRHSKDWIWSLVGIIVAIGSICVMVWVYLRTRDQTNRQILDQQKDTEKQLKAQEMYTTKQINAQAANTKQQIEEQRKISSEQIAVMQKQSSERIASLEKMGNQIGEYTGEIQKSVKHFEDKYLSNVNRTVIENAMSEISEMHDQLCRKLKDDYDHFDIESQSHSAYKEFYNECYSKIKKHIEKLENAFYDNANNIQMPDPNPYLESINLIVNKPSFLYMDAQNENLVRRGEEFQENLKISVEELLRG